MSASSTSKISTPLPDGWVTKTLGELGKCIKGVSYNPETHLHQGDLPITMRLLRSNNVRNGVLEFRNLQFVDIKQVNQFQILQQNDIVICMANGSKKLVGKAAIFNQQDNYDYTFGAFMGCFRTSKPLVNSTFIAFMFQTVLYRSFIKILLSGSSINNLSAADIQSIQIPYPPPIEQTTIARILTTTDALLQALDQLITKKQHLLQATLHALLTRQKRLPEFTGAWETKALGDVVIIKKGTLITKTTTHKGNIPVIAGGMQPAYYANKANRKPDVITISASGANAGYVAFHTYPIFASDCSTIEAAKAYNVSFIHFLMKAKQQHITKLQTGGAQPHVYPEQLKTIPISYPAFPEQTAIAHLLTTMQQEITALQAQRTHYHHLHTALMQQLLTGQIRV